MIAVQSFDLLPEIDDQIRLCMDRQILIALLTEQPNEFLLQLGLALIAVGPGLYRLIFRDNGVFTCLGDDVEIRHAATFFLMLSP